MSLVALDSVPAFIQRERLALAEIATVNGAAEAEDRAAKIASLAKLAGLAVPIQNEATFLRAEALARLAELVDEGQARGEIPSVPGPKSSGSRTISEATGVTRQRIAEGRAIARTGVLEDLRSEAEKRPDVPVSMTDILKRAQRRLREQALRERTAEHEREARAAGVGADLVVADLRFWDPGPVDAIITDPPYVGDSIPLYEALRDFALRTLKPGGPLVVMTWQAILPDVIAALREPSLDYRWTICWRYANIENTADQRRRVFDCWKPVLVYHRESWTTSVPMFRDEIAVGTPDKEHHEWGQPVEGFVRLVRSFSQPGDVVCDPFLGGGTTAVAALAEARQFVGCDIDERAVTTTKERLAA